MFCRAGLRSILTLLSVFVASRLLFGLAGVRFDGSTLTHFWQIIDPVELREHLGRSLWYCHAQPPLFILFIGLVLKLAGDASAFVFQGIYLAASFASHLGTFALLSRMGVARTWAVTLTILAMISPVAVLYENQLFYDLLVNMFVTWSAVALLAWLNAARGCQDGSAQDAVADACWRPRPGLARGQWHLAMFGALVLALCLTRSLYHLAFIIGVGLYLAAAQSARRSATLALMLVLTLVTAGWYAKNLLVFDHFTASTWMGMNMSRVVRHEVSSDELHRLHEQGLIAEVTLVPPFSPLDQYAPHFADAGRFADIPMLATASKSNGEPNFFHVGYIAISDLYARDAVTLARRHPQSFLWGYVRSWYEYARPASVNIGFNENRSHLGMYDLWWTRLMYGRISLPLAIDRKHPEVYLFFAAGLVVALAYGVRRWFRYRHAARPSPSAWTPAQRVVAGYMLLMIVYVMAVGNLFESGENYRYRYYTESFVLCFFALFVQDVVWSRLRPGGPRGAKHT